MCDQTEVSYLPDDVVWVKLSNVWWPAQVQDETKLSEDVTSGLRKKPLAVVKFFEEDSYEFPKTLNQIYHYNCFKKDEFIKRGLELSRPNGNRDISHMKKFSKDVINAEILTGGNPDIIHDTKYLPEEKFDYREQFGLKPRKKASKDRDSKRLSTDSNSSLTPKRPKVKFSTPISAPSTSRTPEVKISNESKSFSNPIKKARETRIPQRKHTPIVIKREPVNIENQSGNISEFEFACSYCNFVCHRMGVLLSHYEAHYAGLAHPPPHHVPHKYFKVFKNNVLKFKKCVASTPITMPKSIPGKTSLKRRLAEESSPIKRRKSESAKKEKTETPCGSSSAVPVIKDVVGIAGATPKKRSRKSKEAKTVTVKEPEALDILKDWEEDLDEEMEMELEPVVAAEPAQDITPKPTMSESFSENEDHPQPTPQEPKEKCCFDFEDNDESLNLNKSLKFGQKLPRVISEEKPNVQRRLKELKDSEESCSKEDFTNEDIGQEVEDLLKNTEVPKLPDIPLATPTKAKICEIGMSEDEEMKKKDLEQGDTKQKKDISPQTDGLIEEASKIVSECEVIEKKKDEETVGGNDALLQSIEEKKKTSNIFSTKNLSLTENLSDTEPKELKEEGEKEHYVMFIEAVDVSIKGELKADTSSSLFIDAKDVSPKVDSLCAPLVNVEEVVSTKDGSKVNSLSIASVNPEGKVLEVNNLCTAPADVEGDISTKVDTLCVIPLDVKEDKSKLDMPVGAENISTKDELKVESTCEASFLDVEVGESKVDNVCEASLDVKDGESKADMPVGAEEVPEKDMPAVDTPMDAENMLNNEKLKDDKIESDLQFPAIKSDNEQCTFKPSQSNEISSVSASESIETAETNIHSGTEDRMEDSDLREDVSEVPMIIEEVVEDNCVEVANCEESIICETEEILDENNLSVKRSEAPELCENVDGNNASQKYLEVEASIDAKKKNPSSDKPDKKDINDSSQVVQPLIVFEQSSKIYQGLSKTQSLPDQDLSNAQTPVDQIPLDINSMPIVIDDQEPNMEITEGHIDPLPNSDVVKVYIRNAGEEKPEDFQSPKRLMTVSPPPPNEPSIPSIKKVTIPPPKNKASSKGPLVRYSLSTNTVLATQQQQQQQSMYITPPLPTVSGTLLIPRQQGAAYVSGGKLHPATRLITTTTNPQLVTKGPVQKKNITKPIVVGKQGFPTTAKIVQKSTVAGQVVQKVPSQTIISNKTASTVVINAPKMMISRPIVRNLILKTPTRIQVSPQVGTKFVKTTQLLKPVGTVFQQAEPHSSLKSVVQSTTPNETNKLSVKSKQLSPNILQKTQRKPQRQQILKKAQVLTIPSSAQSQSGEVVTVSNLPIVQSIGSHSSAEPVKMLYLVDNSQYSVESPVLTTENDKRNIFVTSTSNSTNLDNLIFSIDGTGNLVNICNQAATSSNTRTSSEDILAKALANTQVLQSDTTDIVDTVYVDQQYPAPSLSNTVLETSLTLNQPPIMTPLEVPSSIAPQSNISHIIPITNISKKSDIQQPSMPLLTDDLEVPGQAVFLSGDASEIPTTSSHLTFQLVHDSSIAVSSGPLQENSSKSGTKKEDNVLPEFLKGNFGKSDKKDASLKRSDR